jgi:hypothetical protein
MVGLLLLGVSWDGNTSFAVGPGGGWIEVLKIDFEAIVGGSWIWVSKAFGSANWRRIEVGREEDIG